MWRRWRWSVVVLIVAIFGPTQPASGQPETPQIDVAAVDEIVKKAGIQANGPGAAVLICQAGQPVLRRCYGQAILKTKRPITTRTCFDLASVSKQFTAMAVMILQDRGRVSFDDDVRKYIPELPEYDQQRPIRITDLLRHTSGLPEYFEFEDLQAPTGGFLRNADFAAEFRHHLACFPLTFPPGSQHVYTNSNYMLLALLVERVGNKSFGQFMADEVFTPLGMKDAWVYEGHTFSPPDAAIGYRPGRDGVAEECWGPPPYRKESVLTTGDGMVWCSLDDMARWETSLTNAKLIKRSTWEQATRPSKTLDGKVNDYGFGWALALDAKGRLKGMGHGGGWGGFTTRITRNLQTRRTIIVLSNSGEFRGSEACRQLERLLDCDVQ